MGLGVPCCLYVVFVPEEVITVTVETGCCVKWVMLTDIWNMMEMIDACYGIR